MNIFQAFQDFLIYLRLHKGRSRNTQEQYAFHIWRFCLWTFGENISKDEKKELRSFRAKDFLPPLEKEACKGWHTPLGIFAKKWPDISIEQFQKKDFDAWRLSLADTGLSIKTVNAHIITLRSWLKYLKREQLASLDPSVLDLMKVTDREVTFLSDEEIHIFFESIPRDTIQGIRNYAICECIYSTGLRISELTSLNTQDINLESGEFGIRGKGGKLRIVYLTESAKEAISQYLEARDDSFAPLFIRHNIATENIHNAIFTDESVRLSRFFITNMIREYGIRAGILKSIHAHTLRHSFATTILSHGADIRIIQELLGHASITTTQVYTHVTNPRLKEAHKKYHP